MKSPQHRTVWLVPPKRIPWTLAAILAAVLIMINERAGRIAEAHVAAGLARLVGIDANVLDINGTPVFAVTRTHTWQGTGLELAQTATLWVGIAIAALGLALLWRRTRPGRLAASAAVAVAVIIGAAQIRLVSYAATVVDGSGANAATDAIGGLVVLAVATFAVAGAILTSQTRGKRVVRARQRSLRSPVERSATSVR